MNNYRFVLPLLIFLSPLLYILSGCQWKPDAHAAPAKSVWVFTDVVAPPEAKPVVVPVVEIKPAAPVTYDPNRVPAPGDPYAPPPRVTLPKSNPPLVNAEELCTDGSCSVQGGSGGGRRGLFGRWRR